MIELRSNESISVVDYRKLSRCACYGWSRNGVYLYIGMTTRGYFRINNHNIIDKVEPLLDSDYIDFWYCDQTELASLERRLIEWFKPKYNLAYLVKSTHKQFVVKKAVLPRIAYCSTCGAKFKPKSFSDTLCWNHRLHDKVDVRLALSPKDPPKLVKLPPQ